PTNYVDNIPRQNVTIDLPSGLEHGALDPNFHPTSDNGTGLAFATLDAQLRNTDSGKAGVVCMVCHSLAETRNTPYHTFDQTKGSGYQPALGTGPRAQLVARAHQDVIDAPDGPQSSLGYSVGSGAYRLSPHAIGTPERLGPLSSPQRPSERDGYL